MSMSKLPVLNKEQLATLEPDDGPFDMPPDWQAKVKVDDNWEANPLFMRELNQSPEENEKLAALASLIYADSTPDEIGENFRNQGNESLKANSHRDAIIYYSRGLEQPLTDMKLKCALLSNRAHVQILMKNYGHAVNDCKSVLEIDANHAKALFRAAKACNFLGRSEEALSFAQRGVEVDASGKEMKEQLDIAEAEVEKKRKAEVERKKRHKAKETEIRKGMKAIMSRGIQVGYPEVDSDHWNALDTGAVPDGHAPAAASSSSASTETTKTPYVDADNELHFSCLLLYDDHKQSDFIRDVAETHSLRDHLSVILPPEGPEFPWDSTVKMNNVEVYYRKTNRIVPKAEAEKGSHLVLTDAQREKLLSDYGDSQEMIRVRNLDTPIWQICKQPEFVLPGNMLVFHVVKRGSDLSAKWSKK